LVPSAREGPPSFFAATAYGWEAFISFLEIPKTERIGHIPSHAQEHHIQRIMKPHQNLGNACSEGRSWSRDLPHRVPKQS